MEAMIIFRDWFHQPTIESEPDLGQALSKLKARLSRRFAGFTSYEFLPLGFVDASKDELQALVEDPLIQYVIEVSDGWRHYRETFEIVLNALNALRSQTGHQLFEWYTHIVHGGTLPHNDFEGGWWPPRGGYPRLKDFISGRIEADDSLVLGATPAWMPVINLSVQPAGVIHEVNDPVLFAFAAISQTHLIVVAAGNGGPKPASLNPWAASEAVLSVGATDDEEGSRLWDRSSRGNPDGKSRGPDLVAWGQATSGDFGTSYAAPNVAMMGVFCSALLAQVQHAWLLARDRRDIGVPLMGWGLVDVSDQTLDVPERLETPALPILGVRLDVMVQALREVEIRVALEPPLLKKIILKAARPMPGYHKHEVGAGFIRDDLVIEYLATMTVGDVVRWFSPEAHLRGDLAQEPAFVKNELQALAQVVRRSAPAWFWDVDRESFIVNGRIVTPAGSDFDSILRASLKRRRVLAGHAYDVIFTGLTEEEREKG
jgi:hypothetical protein